MFVKPHKSNSRGTSFSCASSICSNYPVAVRLGQVMHIKIVGCVTGKDFLA